MEPARNRANCLLFMNRVRSLPSPFLITINEGFHFVFGGPIDYNKSECIRTTFDCPEKRAWKTTSTKRLWTTGFFFVCVFSMYFYCVHDILQGRTPTSSSPKLLTDSMDWFIADSVPFGSLPLVCCCGVHCTTPDCTTISMGLSNTVLMALSCWLLLFEGDEDEQWRSQFKMFRPSATADQRSEVNKECQNGTILLGSSWIRANGSIRSRVFICFNMEE